MKYIDAERLKAEIEKLLAEAEIDEKKAFAKKDAARHLAAVTKTAVCVKIKKLIAILQQEQPDDVCSVIKEYYGKEVPFEDERTKAAYHFFSAGRAFELKKIEEERVKHITDLLDNYQKGKKAGYKEAVSELKEGKIECSPVMKELIDKLFGIGHAYNFGFGPKDFQQEQPDNMIQWTGSNLQEVIDFTGKSPKFGEWFKSWDEFESYVHSHGDILKLFSEDGSHFEVPVGAWIVKTPDGYNVPSVAKFIHAKQEQPEVDLVKASRNVYESWMGGTMNDVRRDMVELGRVLNTRKV